MKAAWLAAALAALLAIAASPQNSPGGERVESGQLPGVSGPPLAWRVRLLPVSSFPNLPPAVAAQLGLRQCMIPQSYEAQQPENVVHGAFLAPGSDDWAVLCSVHQVTTLYVFFAGRFDSPVALRSQGDSDWLGAEPGSHIFGSAWGIALSTAAEMQASPQLRRLLHPDHDGIQDEHLERSATVRYYQDGKWLAVTTGG